MTRPVAVTGAPGQLGRALVRACELARVPVAPLSRADLDITDADAVEAALKAIGPAVVLNCASYNDVDGAEQDPRRALEVNAFGVRALARAARAAGALLLHYSTDFVFDGTGTRPYSEDDTPNPQSVYAASKLLGEWFALEEPESYVLRVESLFGEVGAHGRHSSLEKIVRGIEAGDEVAVFTDRTVSPSYVHDVAAATLAVVRTRPQPGIYHCVNGGSTTWEGLAREAARQLGKTPRLKLTKLADVRLAASRPAFCALANDKLAAAGIPMPAWQDAVARFLAAR